ncbi:MAG: 1-acyl-sn-glycerol-3-phosphate acyltransferase [Alphaproteobacteria bacterium]|nr:1-acyl-sn-glycerol-3-phosphate acyltransferase [Alphaproteobacteria bacterium]
MFRSVIFAILFYLVSAIMCIVYLPFFVAPRIVFATVSTSWMIVMLFIIRYVLGIKYVIKGAEHRPDGPVIYAAKHQSAWDVIAFKVLVSDCAYVLKRELYRIPLWGWYVWRCGMIGVDRDGGGAALKAMVKSSIEVLKAGRSIVIFPQGTRTPTGADRPYLPGIAALYGRANTTVVPVALNSGLFWPRRQFQKFPGTITVEFLPPIPPGLKRREFMKTLEERIETATRRLEAEAQGDAPHTPVDNTVESSG